MHKHPYVERLSSKHWQYYCQPTHSTSKSYFLTKGRKIGLAYTYRYANKIHSTSTNARWSPPTKKPLRHNTTILLIHNKNVASLFKSHYGKLLLFGTLRNDLYIPIPQMYSLAPLGFFETGSPIAQAPFEHLTFLSPLSWVLGLQEPGPASGSEEVFSRSKKDAEVRWRILTQDGDCSGKQTLKLSSTSPDLRRPVKSRLRRHLNFQVLMH